MARMLIGLAAVLAALLAAALLAPDRFARTMEGPDAMGRVAYLAVLALLVSGGLVAGFRMEGRAMLRYALIWLGIGGAIALLYVVLERPG